MSERALRGLVVALFVLSGAAGLMYEVVWARQLVLVFGNTTQAVSAILTGFFGGMAVGAFFGGRVADRLRSPLRLYAAAELGLGIVALLTPILFAGIRELYSTAYPDLASNPSALGFVRFVLAVLAVAPATILMGATLPSLTRHLTRSVGQLGGQFGRLYAANTLGGILCTAAAGYFFIELLGLHGTVRVAAAASFAAGLGGLMLSRRLPPALERPTDAVTLPSAPAAGGHRSLVLLVAFVSGLMSLGYQVLWTRLMSTGTTNSSYVFTTILLFFLTGIALGAVLHGRGLGRRVQAVSVLGASQLLVAVIAFVGLPLIGDLRSGVSAWLAVILPATVVMGFALPLAAGLMGESERRVGSDSGLLLAVNTVGTVVGTFVVPFFLLPLVGSGLSVVMLATTNALLGTLLMTVAARASTRLRPVAAGAGLVAIAIAAASLLNPTLTESPMARVVARDGTLLASTEDEIASVQAGLLGGEYHLWVAGVSMTGLTVDTKLMPLLPLAARPKSTSALIVAFGMGTSHRSALIAGLEVESVELVPSVPQMFGQYYADAADVLANPRGRVVIADGRNHVALTDDKFDIVLADPPPPIRSAGTGVLYAREFYEACRAALEPGGVMMEWMPHDQPIEDFRAHMRTFQAVFEHVEYVLSPGGYGVYMLGSDDQLTVSEQRIRAVLERPGVLADVNSAPDAAEATVTGWAERIGSLRWLTDDAAVAFAGTGPQITDDRPLTEYFLLRTLGGAPSGVTSHDRLRAASGTAAP
jgi:spermidine synthase